MFYVFAIFPSPAYQLTALPPVEEAIKQLHATVNNADTEDYSIVYGVGATNVLFMVITAMSRNIINVSAILNCPCMPTITLYLASYVDRQGSREDTILLDRHIVYT